MKYNNIEGMKSYLKTVEAMVEKVTFMNVIKALQELDFDMTIDCNGKNAASRLFYLYGVDPIKITAQFITVEALDNLIFITGYCYGERIDTVILELED